MDRRFQVKTNLSAAEFVLLQAMAEQKGLSQSSLIRMWLHEADSEQRAGKSLDTDWSQSGTQ